MIDGSVLAKRRDETNRESYQERKQQRDGVGVLAVGALTGRAAGDPVGQMTQAEQVAFTGTCPQTEVEGRWGDYSDLTVDPSDDCTFFYTNEYLKADGTFNWSTQIASFKLAGCR